MTASLPNSSANHSPSRSPNRSLNTALGNSDTSQHLQPKTTKPLTLRPYQTALINDLYLAMNQGYRRIAIIAGTGAGKTVIGGQICAHAEAKGCWLLFVVHLDVLVGQTYEKDEVFWAPLWLYQSGVARGSGRADSNWQYSDHGQAGMVANMASQYGVL